MKSMLHEASSVAKAAEKAWIESGRPTEFTIRVLEVGEKNFFGFCKSPSIISITFDPNKQLDKSKKTDTNVNRDLKRQPLPVRPFQNQQSKVHVRPLAQKNNANVVRNKPQLSVQNQPHAKQSVNFKPLDLQQPQVVVTQEPQTWQKEWIENVKIWLKDIIDIWGIDVTFELSAKEKVLSIEFNKHLVDSILDEKAVFVSLSYLLIQFLKKSLKKKMPKYQVVFSVKESNAHDGSKSDFNDPSTF